jgi:DNA excision repair protein ERCC-8
MEVSNILPQRKRSNPSLIDDLYSRSIYAKSCFVTEQSIRLSRNQIQFNIFPQIISPHTSQITSLDIDNSCEGRFLLSSSKDCTISVYDLSLLGSNYHLHKEYDEHIRQKYIQNGRMSHERYIWEEQNKFRPIAQSQRILSPEIERQRLNPLFVPSGHSSSVTVVKWYPVDTGVFVSADSCGKILLWDTNQFVPVLSLNSLHVDHHGSFGVYSLDLPKRLNSHVLLAIGGSGTGKEIGGDRVQIDEKMIYLCDIRSGSITHSLIGHSGGINCLQWSPTYDYILASGSSDGTIKLWDVRKSGSKSCLLTLDRASKYDKHEIAFGDKGTSRVKKKKRQETGGPGNYSTVEVSKFVQSHGGSVSSLAHTPDGDYIISTSPSDGIKLWNVQGKAGRRLLPTKFLNSSPSPGHPLNRRQQNIPIYITQPSSAKTATLWVAGRNQMLLGYEVHGMGGTPNKVISGHLGNVSSIASQENCMRLFSGGSDGMILCYGNRNEFYPDREGSEIQI